MCAFHHGAPGWLYLAARARAEAVDLAVFPTRFVDTAALDRVEVPPLLRLAAATADPTLLRGLLAGPVFLGRVARLALLRLEADTADLAFFPAPFAAPAFLDRIECFVLLRFTVGALRFAAAIRMTR